MTIRNQRLSLLKQPISSTLNQHLIDYPTPSNLSYWWGFGSLAGICLVIQIVTGVFLAMHYTPHVDLAFNSVEHIMRDVEGGWLLRYMHANGATFIGYVLPWGQMSFWGATVITSLASAIPVVGELAALFMDFPLVPLGTLSLEEQRAVDELVRLEGRLIRTARCVLESLGYSPQPGDIKTFVQIFIVDIDSSDYDDLVLALIDEKSPIFLQFLEEWEIFLADNSALKSPSRELLLLENGETISERRTKEDPILKEKEEE
ncbi:hypothetical protein KY284_027638 [Solanum tuberosum]|nr:hypothetical protein KY284_027638 [Solanum tuberosum]